MITNLEQCKKKCHEESQYKYKFKFKEKTKRRSETALVEFAKGSFEKYLSKQFYFLKERKFCGILDSNV